MKKKEDTDKIIHDRPEEEEEAELGDSEVHNTSDEILIIVDTGKSAEEAELEHAAQTPCSEQVWTVILFRIF